MRYTTPCTKCDGDGVVYGYLTVNPSEEPREHTCWVCNGRGTVDVEPDAEPLDELMLWAVGTCLLFAIVFAAGDIMAVL
jgi:hypothetical protein